MDLNVFERAIEQLEKLQSGGLVATNKDTDPLDRRAILLLESRGLAVNNGKGTYCFAPEVSNKSILELYCDAVIAEASDSPIALTQGVPQPYQRAISKLQNIGILENRHGSISLRLSASGQEAFDEGGIANWMLSRQKKDLQEPSINISTGDGSTVIQGSTVHDSRIISGGNKGEDDKKKSFWQDFLSSITAGSIVAAIGKLFGLNS